MTSAATTHILVTGLFRWPMYERQFCDALRRNGVRVTEVPVDPLLGPTGLFRRAQEHFARGPGAFAANALLAWRVVRHRPDAVFAWRAPWLRPWVMKALRRAGARVALYNNDDPFGPDRDQPAWRHYRRAIPVADACFAYRSVNIEDYREHGARHVFMLRSAYDPILHRPLELTSGDRRRFHCDAVYVGHYEPDDRVDHLDALLVAGMDVRVHGSDWDRCPRGRPVSELLPVQRVVGEDYVKALCGAKVALAFFSKRNRDGYSRRCFEIPATGTVLVAPRTAEMTELYREGIEAVYFSSPAELVDAVQGLLADDGRRRRIALAGRDRARISGYDVDSRVREFLADLASLTDERVP